MRTPVTTTLYRHFKGAIYRVVGEHPDPTTGERVIDYVRLWDGLQWERVASEFFGTVEKPIVVGGVVVSTQTVPRFAPVYKD